MAAKRATRARRSRRADNYHRHGRCSFCGCTDHNACEGGCSWISPQHTCCSRCLDAILVIGAMHERGFQMALSFMGTAHKLPPLAERFVGVIDMVTKPGASKGRKQSMLDRELLGG